MYMYSTVHVNCVWMSSSVSTFFLCRAEEGEGESSGEEEEEEEEEGEEENAEVVQEEKVAVEAKPQEVASAVPSQRDSARENSQPKQDSPRCTC